MLNKHGQRKYFLLIETYQSYFSTLFEALGMNLYVNENERLVGLLPVEREAFVKLRNRRKHFSYLVLRQMYEEKSRKF